MLATGRASLMCEAPVFNFGTRSAAEGRLTHAFEVYNGGADAVTVTALRASCECLTAGMARRTLLPGERAAVDVLFQFGEYTGAQMRRMHLVFRSGQDPAAPPAILTLTLAGTLLPTGSHAVGQPAPDAVPSAGAVTGAVSRPSGGEVTDPVRLDLFVSAGCAECARVKREVLPAILARFGDACRVVSHDLALPETVPLLLAYQARGGDSGHGRVAVVVDHSVFLSGYATIAERLSACMDEAMRQRQTPGWRPPLPPDAVAGEAGAERVRRRGGAMTLGVVVLGGLVDGFNPCAISTLIFFMSVLGVAKTGRRTRLLVGVSFIAASFLVYFGLGLGLLLAFRQMPRFDAIRRIVELVIGVCMVPLAVLSFRDAARFHRTQRVADVSLQLPEGIKTRIHALARRRLGVGGPMLGGLAVGAGVTVLESVCTGQGYVPVLAFLARQGGSGARVWALLAVYNLLFVLPLAVVFTCFHQGLQIPALLAWSRRNVPVVKILLGIFFAAMAVLLLRGV